MVQFYVRSQSLSRADFGTVGVSLFRSFLWVEQGAGVRWVDVFEELAVFAVDLFRQQEVQRSDQIPQGQSARVGMKVAPDPPVPRPLTVVVEPEQAAEGPLSEKA